MEKFSTNSAKCGRVRREVVAFRRGVPTVVISQGKNWYLGNVAYRRLSPTRGGHTERFNC